MNYDEFHLKLDFQRGSPDPSRVFRGMAEYIDAFRLFDSNLVAPFQLGISTHQEIADIEASSIKAIIRRVLNCLDEEALKEGNWNKLLGHFLHKSKHSILTWCNDKKEITDLKEIEEKAAEITFLAEATDLRHIPAYTKFTSKTLVLSVQAFIQAGQILNEKESIVYGCSGQDIPVRTAEVFPKELIEEVITPTERTERFQAIVVIKKPDYLGESKWQFKMDGRSIYAHILDQEWIKSFRNREFFCIYHSD